MTGLSGETAYLAEVLTGTTSGYKWCLDFFHAAEYAQWKGEYGEKEEWFRTKFAESASKNYSGTDTSDVDWKLLYDYCFEKARRKREFSTESTGRVAGLIITVPDFFRALIDTFAAKLRTGLDPVADRAQILPDIKMMVINMMKTPGIKNLDVGQVEWAELYDYAWENCKTYSKAVSSSEQQAQ